MLTVQKCAYCDPDSPKFQDLSWILLCRCNESIDEPLEWRWCKPESPLQSFQLSENDKTVTFHPTISWGTAVARGTALLTNGLHYWELKAVSPLYGTDVMVGIGRTCAKLDHYSQEFRSVLGIDCDSWGLSYRGALMHDGQTYPLGSCAFKKGSIIGCLLDLWHLKLYFYVDGQLNPNACFNLPRDNYYPMVSSTTLRSGFRLIRAKSYPITLQYLICQYFLHQQQKQPSLHACFNLTTLKFPAGLREILSNTLPHSLFFNQIQQLSFIYNDVNKAPSLLPVDSSDPFLWISFSPSDSNDLKSSAKGDMDKFDIEPCSPKEFDLYSDDLLNERERSVDKEDDSSDENHPTCDGINETNFYICTTTESSQKRRYQAAMSANCVLDRLFVLAAKSTKKDDKSSEPTSHLMRNMNSVVYDHALWGEFDE
ncbi:unnamed protein product [Schistosoma intercalatum]|nr:unnamed protein product [Schistosoma intercalatum]CAH8622222.1 unnamed protein product [Schistosoma intercalatum]